MPEELKPYLSLYLEVLFESPILKDGGASDEAIIAVPHLKWKLEGRHLYFLCTS